MGLHIFLVAAFVASICAKPTVNDMYGYYNDHHNDPQHNDLEHYTDLLSNQIPNLPAVAEAWDGEGEEETNTTAMFLKNPCISRVCERGAMCRVTNLEKYETECFCPTYCEPGNEPVCSVYGKEYESKCHLHMEACKQDRNIGIAYEGACITSKKQCTSSSLNQFPARFLEWMMHVRDEEIYGAANLKKNVVELPSATQIHVAQWMFERMDVDSSKTLAYQELTGLLMYLMSVETCIGEFLQSCDIDHNEDITIREWKICLMPGSNLVEDEYFDNV